MKMKLMEIHNDENNQRKNKQINSTYENEKEAKFILFINIYLLFN